MRAEVKITQEDLNRLSRIDEPNTILSEIKCYLISLYVWSALFLSTIPYFPVTFTLYLLSPFIDPKKKILRKVGVSWLRLARWIHPLWQIKHSGFENIEKGKRYIIVSNHQSYGDIIVLSYLPVDFKFVTKQELFYFPSFGWQVYFIGHIGVKRGDKESVIKFMEKAKNSLRQGISLMMFPEGTRTKTGEVQNFKDGAFRLAIETSTPILPVTISGSFNALPRGTIIIRNRTYVRVHVDKPISVEGLRMEDLERLKNETRNVIIQRKRELDKEVYEELKKWKNK